MKTRCERFQIVGAEGEIVRGYVHVSCDRKKLPTVLLAHGFKGFAEYGFLPRLADKLAEARMAVISFSFSHCGITDNPDRFDRLDLFEKDTFACQVADVLALIQAVNKGTLPQADQLDPDRIAAVGHSRGGVSAILATDATSVLRAIVTLASPDQTVHDEELRDQLRRLGRVVSPSTRTGQDLIVGRAVVDDIDAAGERYDLARLLERFRGAFMALHCRGDDTVDSACSERLALAHTGAPTRLVLLPGGGHTFDFKHGQSGSTATLDTVIEEVKKFLTEHLS